MPLSEMLRLFSEKFKQQEIFHIIKSLTYFEDAEQYADPKVFDTKVTWKKVKNRVFKEVQQLAWLGFISKIQKLFFYVCIITKRRFGNRIEKIERIFAQIKNPPFHLKTYKKIVLLPLDFFVNKLL